jgi:hypothetical protein
VVEPTGSLLQYVDTDRTGWTKGVRYDDPRVVRHGHHTRKAAPDPLAAIAAATFLTVRDICGVLLELTELPPRADQRAVLEAARKARITAGWQVGDIGPSSAVFFAERNGERVAVGIEREPRREIRR